MSETNNTTTAAVREAPLSPELRRHNRLMALLQGRIPVASAGDADIIMCELADRQRSTIAEVLPPYIDERQFGSACRLAARELVDALKPDQRRNLTAGMLGEVCLQTAQLGMMPGKSHAHVAWIYRNAWGDRPAELSLMPQWQGYKFILEQVPGVSRVTARLVHRLDDVRVQFGSVEAHSYDPFDAERVFRHPSDLPKGAPMDLRGGYVEIVFADGSIMHHFVTAADIERRRMCSVPETKRGKPGPWRLWYPEMALGKCYRDVWAKRVLRVEDATIVQRVRGLIEAEDRYQGNDPRRVPADVARQLARESASKPRDASLVALGLAHEVAEIVEPEVMPAEKPVAKAKPSDDKKRSQSRPKPVSDGHNKPELPLGDE